MPLPRAAMGEARVRRGSVRALHLRALAPRLGATWLVAMVLLLSTAGAVAQGVHTVEVVDTWPPGAQVSLAPGGKFYLRIAWSTDSMTRIHARPWLEGREVAAWTSPSPRYDRGSGETVAWFSFDSAGMRADEVRIFVGNSRPRLAAVHRVSLTSASTAAAAAPAPAWVAELESRVVDATGGPREPPDPADGRWLDRFMLAVAALALFGLLAPLWGVVRWRGRWRIAAAVPMVAMGLFATFLLLTALFNPGSLNLLPLVVLMAAVPCSLFIAALFLARMLTGASRKGST